MEVISGGVATLGLLLPLLWRILTEGGEWTRAGSRVFPLGSRVLLYAAYTLLAVTLVAYNALASTSSMLDPNTLQELGDFLLGTPPVRDRARLRPDPDRHQWDRDGGAAAGADPPGRVSAPPGPSESLRPSGRCRR